MKDLRTRLNDYQAAWSSQDIDGILDFFADDFQFEDIPIGLAATNKEEMKEVLTVTFSGVPNFKMEIFDVVDCGKVAVTKWKQTGNMTVQGYGLDLNDFAYEVTTTSTIKFNDKGKIISLSDNWNTGVFYQ